jgi:hypothetical protein
MKMSRAWIAALTACVAVAAVSTAAAARTEGAVHKLKGKMAGDANSAVSVKVVVRNGDPRRLKELEFKRLDAFCGDDPAGELSGKGGRNLGPGVEFDNSFNWFSFPQQPAPRQVNMFGKLRREGKKLGGRLEVLSNSTCANAQGRVTLRK